MDNSSKVRFGIVLTYDCNMACKGCNRFLDIQPWKDTYLSPNDLEEGYNRVEKSGFVIEKVRVTGGEPLLHPQFVECMEVIQKTWNKDYGGRTCVFSNGIAKRPTTNGWRYRVSTGESKCDGFHPPMISPYDLGLEPYWGVVHPCRRQLGCGRLFDVFGFSFCIFAGAIGRLVGIDPYSPTPVSLGISDICKHCVFSLGIKKAFDLFSKVKKGQIEYPTKTYAEAIKYSREHKFGNFKRFSYR